MTRRIEQVQRELDLNAMTCRCLLREVMTALERGETELLPDLKTDVADAMKEWEGLADEAMDAWKRMGFRFGINGGAS